MYKWCMEGEGVDGGCKNFADEKSVASSFYSNNNNEHVTKIHAFDWFRKIG